MALMLTALFSCVATAQQPVEDSTLKIDTTLVSVPVIVSDRQGRYVSGLTREDFTLFDDKVRQPIAFFAAVEEPLNIAMLLDTSRSTQFVLDDIKKAARLMLRKLRPADRAMIVSFDYRVQILCELTGDRKRLERAVDRAQIGEYVGTTLYDGISEVTWKSFKQVSGRKAVILLTDGKDAGSSVRADDLLDSVAESDTMIYSIFYSTGMPFMAGERFPRPGRRRNPQVVERRKRRVERVNRSAAEFLQSLSENSAGRYYQSDVTDLARTFTLVVDELRHQYRLGFYPDEDNLDGTIHELRVRVNQHDVAVRARKSYRVESLR